MTKKRYRRVLLVAWKVAQLSVKLTLVRCFGIEGAACMLAGIVATADRLRAAFPIVCTFARQSGRRALGVLAAKRFNPLRNKFTKTVSD